VFTGRWQDGGRSVLVGQLLADFPVAVLSKDVSA
jgi:hypothetical protein